jgi:hypothetical protein
VICRKLERKTSKRCQSTNLDRMVICLKLAASLFGCASNRFASGRRSSDRGEPGIETEIETVGRFLFAKYLSRLEGGHVSREDVKK